MEYFIAYMGIGTRAHRIIAIIQISIVTIRIMHAISILYSSLCSLNAAMRTIALTSAIIAIPFHNHESSCINCIGSLPFWNLGLPPRVWGKGLRLSICTIDDRITPTYVGKREKTAETVILSHGSPPRMWGKSHGSNRNHECCRDHPHVCGKKVPLPLKTLVVPGSPPRMWEKEHRALPLADRDGITPTYVGKRQIFTLKLTLKRDHPHVCGKKT